MERKGFARFGAVVALLSILGGCAADVSEGAELGRQNDAVVIDDDWMREDGPGGASAATAQGASTGEETARDHALANDEYVQASAALAAAGWTVDAAAASVQRFDASLLEDGTVVTDPVTWTRVVVPLKAPAADATSGESLVVTWREGGPDVFALAGDSEEDAAKLVAGVDKGSPGDLSLVDSSADILYPEDTASEASASAAAACKKLNVGCSRTTRCCQGLKCQASGIYDTCQCPDKKTVSYPIKATASVACFNLPDNPIGAAKIVRTIKGCTSNNGWALTSNACGGAVSVPAYRLSTNDRLVCLTTPGPICRR